MTVRALTQPEKALARSIFGEAIDLDRVRIRRSPWWPFQPRNAIMAPDGDIWCHPRGPLWRDCYASAGLSMQALFVHEMVHVWQAQNGVILPLAKLRAGDSDAAYRYDLDRQSFPEMNIEQQARVVEHDFVLQRQETLITARRPPFPADRYAALRGWWFKP